MEESSIKLQELVENIPHIAIIGSGDELKRFKRNNPVIKTTGKLGDQQFCSEVLSQKVFKGFTPGALFNIIMVEKFKLSVYSVTQTQIQFVSSSFFEMEELKQDLRRKREIQALNLSFAPENRILTLQLKLRHHYKSTSYLLRLDPKTARIEKNSIIEASLPNSVGSWINFNFSNFYSLTKKTVDYYIKSIPFWYIDHHEESPNSPATLHFGIYHRGAFLVRSRFDHLPTSLIEREFAKGELDDGNGDNFFYHIKNYTRIRYEPSQIYVWQYSERNPELYLVVLCLGLRVFQALYDNSARKVIKRTSINLFELYHSLYHETIQKKESYSKRFWDEDSKIHNAVFTKRGSRLVVSVELHPDLYFLVSIQCFLSDPRTAAVSKEMPEASRPVYITDIGGCEESGHLIASQTGWRNQLSVMDSRTLEILITIPKEEKAIYTLISKEMLLISNLETCSLRKLSKAKSGESELITRTQNQNRRFEIRDDCKTISLDDLTVWEGEEGFFIARLQEVPQKEQDQGEDSEESSGYLNESEEERDDNSYGGGRDKVEYMSKNQLEIVELSTIKLKDYFKSVEEPLFWASNKKAKFDFSKLYNGNYLLTAFRRALGESGDITTQFLMLEISSSFLTVIGAKKSSPPSKFKVEGDFYVHVKKRRRDDCLSAQTNRTKKATGDEGAREP